MFLLEMSESTRRTFCIWLVALILAIHAGLLVWSAWVHAPLVDEPAHLSAGLSHWKKFSFDLYRVNPPLLRMVAAFPVLFVPHEEDWSSYSDDLYRRAEFSVGSDFINANPERYRYLLFLARCFCVPLSVLGGYICYRFGTELFGRLAGFLSLLLWCFSPMILAFGYVVMPDVGSAALGIFAFYVFYVWLCSPDWTRSCFAGLALGVAQLTKFTLLTFYPVMIGLWCLHAFLERKTVTRQARFSQSRQLLSLLFLSIAAINFGYGFEGSFIPLKEYEFVSRAMCGDTKWNHEAGFTSTGNRFRETLLGYVPVPVPANYLLGIDVQKKDFELGQDSYFFGEWSKEGWYFYYLVGLFIKEPLGFWVLFAMACSFVVFSRAYRTNTVTEVLLIVPALLILLLISTQAKLNHHLRYAIPILPFLFIFTCRLGQYTEKRIFVPVLSCLLVAWCLLSSLYFYPHSQAYFNTLIGHTKNAPKYLLGSNIEWGQDLFYLEQWCKKNSEVLDIQVAYSGVYPLEHTTIPVSGIPLANDPQPGWFALSVNNLYDREKRYRYFLNYEPVAMAGYSIYIYHVTSEVANRVRREMGLPEINSEQLVLELEEKANAR